MLEESPDLAEWFNALFLGFLEETGELGQTKGFFGVDDEGKLYNTSPPSWYYYFGGSVGRENDPLLSHTIQSYIRVSYTQNNPSQRKLVRGWIWFFVDDNNDGIPENVLDFPVIWNVRAGAEQTFYFSCHIAPLDPFWEGTLGNPYLPLRVLGKYWLFKPQARRTLYAYRFCESYYCCNRYYPEGYDCVANPPPQGFPYWGCVAECLNDLQLEDLVETTQVAEDWRDKWHRSPLLILAFDGPRWRYSPDYFDRIAIWASEDIEIIPNEIVLNGEPIFDCSKVELPEPMCIANWMGPNYGALDFTNSIKRYRLNQLGIHPSQWTQLLIEAAGDIGQTWEVDSLCGELWFRADDPVPRKPWRPKPNDWCGDFVRGKIRDYSGLPILPCCDQEEEKDREPLWYFFGWKTDEVPPPSPGSYKAQFWAIGGNQGDRVSVRWFEIYNGQDYPIDWTRCTWAEDACDGVGHDACNFFGKTKP